MSSRVVHLLLVAVLLLGQVGGWQHELSHHLGVPGQGATIDGKATENGSNPASPDDPADRQCLLCLSFAALALALPGALAAVALLALRFALPAGALRLAPAFPRFAHCARGPPVLS